MRGVILITSMYCIFTYIYHKNQPNEGKYTLWHGIEIMVAIWKTSAALNIELELRLMKRPKHVFRRTPPRTFGGPQGHNAPMHHV